MFISNFSNSWWLSISEQVLIGLQNVLNNLYFQFQSFARILTDEHSALVISTFFCFSMIAGLFIYYIVKGKGL